MSRFAQYYIKFKHDFAPHDWDQRQEHLALLFKKDDSIEFFLGEELAAVDDDLTGTEL